MPGEWNGEQEYVLEDKMENRIMCWRMERRTGVCAGGQNENQEYVLEDKIENRSMY